MIGKDNKQKKIDQRRKKIFRQQIFFLIVSFVEVLFVGKNMAKATREYDLHVEAVKIKRKLASFPKMRIRAVEQHLGGGNWIVDCYVEHFIDPIWVDGSSHVKISVRPGQVREEIELAKNGTHPKLLIGIYGKKVALQRHLSVSIKALEDYRQFKRSHPRPESPLMTGPALQAAAFELRD